MEDSPIDLPQECLILGIDPGTSVTGWGLLRRKGTLITAVDHGCWRTRRQDSLSTRLSTIVKGVRAALETHRPAAVSLEQAFYGRNIQSTLRLGEARGAILAACGDEGIPVYEYATATVKKIVVGSGRADKSQVQFMLQKLLKLTEPPKPHDASDALALAYSLAMEATRPAELRYGFKAS